ncbi:MAG TPA: hypothetical protein VHQ20_02730, partial [Patescibacteria group bacterium]|nr:hypothetical protein [Patescibacteria group bacterium]
FKDKRLDELNQNLAGINSRLGSYWMAFGKGILYGLGTILGAGMAVLLIGWFLNVIGVIPALKTSADQWRSAFQQATDTTKLVPAGNDTAPATSTQQAQ